QRRDGAGAGRARRRSRGHRDAEHAAEGHRLRARAHGGQGAENTPFPRRCPACRMSAMELLRMLDKCRRDQWRVGDIDWSLPPRPMSKEDEIIIVQLFTDMAGIERLSGALFVEQTRRAKDPVLKEIFETFVVDEVRHSHAAQMLADHYDVHHYKI